MCGNGKILIILLIIRLKCIVLIMLLYVCTSCAIHCRCFLNLFIRNLVILFSLSNCKNEILL